MELMTDSKANNRERAASAALGAAATCAQVVAPQGAKRPEQKGTAS